MLPEYVEVQSQSPAAAAWATGHWAYCGRTVINDTLSAVGIAAGEDEANGGCSGNVFARLGKLGSPTERPARFTVSNSADGGNAARCRPDTGRLAGSWLDALAGKPLSCHVIA